MWIGPLTASARLCRQSHRRRPSGRPVNGHRAQLFWLHTSGRPFPQVRAVRRADRGVAPQACPQAVHRVAACRPPMSRVIPRGCGWRASHAAPGLPRLLRARTTTSAPDTHAWPLAADRVGRRCRRSALPSATFPVVPSVTSITTPPEPLCEPDRVRRLAGARGHAGARVRRRPDPAPGHGGRAVGARRDDDLQGRHRRRRRGAPRRRLLPARATRRSTTRSSTSTAAASRPTW